MAPSQETPGVVLVHRLLSAYLRDLEARVPLETAGWVSIDARVAASPEFMELRQRRALENEPQGARVRLDLRKVKDLKALLRGSDAVSRELEYVATELPMLVEEQRRLEKAASLVRQIHLQMKGNEKLWPWVMVIGWWKMLEAAGMPAAIDRVIGAGMSPRDWLTKAPRASFQIAADLGSQLDGGFSFSPKSPFQDGVGEIRPDEFRGAKMQDGAFVSQVKSVIGWDIAVQKISLQVVRAIGLVWFLYWICERDQLIPQTGERVAKLQGVMVSCARDLTGVTPDDIEEGVHTLETVEGCSVAAMISFPEAFG